MEISDSSTVGSLVSTLDSRALPVASLLALTAMTSVDVRCQVGFDTGDCRDKVATCDETCSTSLRILRFSRLRRLAHGTISRTSRRTRTTHPTTIPTSQPTAACLPAIASTSIRGEREFRARLTRGKHLFCLSGRSSCQIYQSSPSIALCITPRRFKIVTRPKEIPKKKGGRLQRCKAGRPLAHGNPT